MEGEYKPEYAEGQILVCFLNKWDMNEGFMSTFLESIGYKLKDQHQYDLPTDGYVVVEVPPGEEEKACNEIKQYDNDQNKQFIDWTARRDLKYERRSKSIDEIADSAKNLEDHSNLSTADYNAKLDEFKALIDQHHEQD